MAKKAIKGEDGKTYIVKTRNTKRWYKRWYSWLGAAIAIIAIGGGAYSYHAYQKQMQVDAVKPVLETDDSNADSSSSTSDTNDVSESTNEDSSSSVELNDGTDVEVKDGQTFKTNYGDTSYDGSDLEIKRVNVAKTKPFNYEDSDDTEHGYISVVGQFTAGTKDLSFLDNEAVLNTTDGQQIDVDYMDSKLIDEINSGATKKFYQVYMIPKMSSTDQFSSIRLKMEVSPQDTSDEDWHTYDFTLDLNK